LKYIIYYRYWYLVIHLPVSMVFQCNAAANKTPAWFPGECQRDRTVGAPVMSAFNVMEIQ